MEVLVLGQWSAREHLHQARVDALTVGYLDRAARRQPHPVDDFLFTYYSHRPARLRRWSPGPGVVLSGHLVHGHWIAVEGGAALGPVKPSVRRTAEFVADLLSRTAARPAQLGCFGLHEWAMVYRGDPRHGSWPLRLGQQETDRIVESLPVRCTHFDAFRHFTPAAISLNVIQPTRESQRAFEQPGCLHAGMDLYKWTYKLSPWVESELVMDCFELALRIRQLDMAASPYDFTGLGLAPVPIETAAGRAEYVDRQRAFAEEAAVLRGRVLDACALLG